MKLSQMTNDQATTFLIRTSQPIANIMEDDETGELFEQVKQTKGMTVSKLIAFILPKVVTVALKSHKDDLYEIVGAFMEKPVAEIGEMNFLVTLKVLRESVDQDFIDFFASSEPLETGQIKG